jgi:hypothetical protein
MTYGSLNITVSSLIAIKQKDKYRFLSILVLLVYILKHLHKFTDFRRYVFTQNFRDVAPTSEVRTAAMFVLLMIGN